MMRAFFLTLIFAVLLLPQPARATSVVYYDDDELFDMADVVTLAVVWRRDVDRSAYPYTRYELETEECFKGCQAKQFIQMTFMGAPKNALEGMDEWLMGMPSPNPFDRVLVYLKRVAKNGYLVPISMGLSHYTFNYHAGLKRHIAHRDIDDLAVMVHATPGRDGGGNEVNLPRDVFATDLVQRLRKTAKKRGAQ